MHDFQGEFTRINQTKNLVDSCKFFEKENIMKTVKKTREEKLKKLLRVYYREIDSDKKAGNGSRIRMRRLECEIIKLQRRLQRIDESFRSMWINANERKNSHIRM